MISCSRERQTTVKVMELRTSQFNQQQRAAKQARHQVLCPFLIGKNENILPALLAHMTAQDGVPFRVFTTSPDLRRGLTALGLGNVPTSSESVKQLVMTQGKRIRSFVMEELEKKKRNGERFCLTFDEWTSTRNRWYMNANVHVQGPKYWSLGLICVQGSMPTEKCISVLEEKLTKFGLSLEHDVVCICTMHRRR